jgi:hypothetical protein
MIYFYTIMGQNLILITLKYLVLIVYNSIVLFLISIINKYNSHQHYDR